MVEPIATKEVLGYRVDFRTLADPHTAVTYAGMYDRVFAEDVARDLRRNPLVLEAYVNECWMEVEI